MSIDLVKALHQARPFQPFLIHLADGRTLEVPHPEFMAQTPMGRTIIVTKDEESLEIVDLLPVVSLEPIKMGERRPT
jgi:hypothetical protein